MGVNSLPKTVTRQRRDCDLNPGPSAPESSMLPLSYRVKTARSKHLNESFKKHETGTASKTVNQSLLATDTSAPFSFFFSGGLRWVLTDLLVLLPETC